MKKSSEVKMKRSDYYKILGCLVGAGEIELAQAFKASRQKAHAELINPTKYAKEAKRLGIKEYNAKTSLKLDRKLRVDPIWVLDNWRAIEKALKREGIVVKARAIARMTKSSYHTILGMLVEEGELELATSFSKTIKAASSS